MLSNLRGRFTRENAMDVHLFSRDDDLADQALGDGSVTNHCAKMLYLLYLSA
jgi:hypothetical protein